ncbi:MAG TPA: TlpA disulfide reductase family protein [Burkholderiaceae bacterium]|nr:TlpA disulfide reductase family protein [Burkholderiaceae bacterium]
MNSNQHTAGLIARRQSIVIGLAIVAAVVALAWMVAGRSSQPAPQVEFKTLTGQQLTTADLRGKVVLVNFWATSCVTCVKEMPMLVDTHRKYASRGYETVAVAMHYDRPDYVVNFTETRGLPFKVVLDVDNRIATAFDKTQITPTSFVLDKHGRIVKRYVGEPKEAELHRLIEQELAAS